MTSPVERGVRLGREVAASAVPVGVGAGALAGVAVALGNRVVAGVAVGILVAACVRGGVRLFASVERRLRALEDSVSIASRVPRGAPLWGQWAVEADFAGLICREIAGGARCVVELGSGATTIVAAAELARYSEGFLISVDHDRTFADQTRAALRAAHLEEWAKIVVAPLQVQTFAGEEIAWYDLSSLEAEIEAPIDLLVVDGPPQLSSRARWPAVPALHSRLSATAVILMDDGRTRPARRAASAWTRAFDDLTLSWVDTTKGAWMLRREERRDEGVVSRSMLAVRRSLNPRPSGSARWPVRR